jgi:hypothetical protein
MSLRGAGFSDPAVLGPKFRVNSYRERPATGAAAEKTNFLQKARFFLELIPPMEKIARIFGEKQKKTFFLSIFVEFNRTI